MEKRTDLELIENIKLKNCSDSLVELSERHSSLCFEIYKKYSHTLANSGTCLHELTKEKDYVLYQAALSFKPDKNVKFSTWLGNNVKFQCLNAITKNSQYITLDSPELNYFVDSVSLENAPEKDTSTLEYILSILEQLKDKRIQEIFKLRYLEG